jgi:rhamnogalacturonan endolyase
VPTKNILMLDSFDSLRPGAVCEAVNGPFREMHAQPACAEDNLGGWSVRVGNWDLPGEKMWQVVETAAGKRLRSCLTACTYDNASIAKGDDDWRDVRVSSTLKLLPPGQGWGGPAGVAFRFLDSQRYYAAVIDEDGYAKIVKRVDANWDTLAFSPIDVKPGRKITITVQAKGAKLRAKIGPVKLEAVDGQYDSGRVGFIGCRPAEFGPITVAALPGEMERLAAFKAGRDARLASKRSAFGRPVVWRKYETSGFGSGRRVRLGDLTGSGGLDFLLLQVNQDRQSGNAIGCMTAMSHEGQVLWQMGTPRPFDGNETSTDLPCQIHDIDGDGRAEVVCVYDGEIRILEGATGKTKAAGPLPAMSPLPQIFKENMLDWGAGFNDQGKNLRVSTIAFADLTGRGRRGEILLCDAYHTLVALGDGFRELWRTVC